MKSLSCLPIADRWASIQIVSLEQSKTKRKKRVMTALMNFQNQKSPFGWTKHQIENNCANKTNAHAQMLITIRF